MQQRRRMRKLYTKPPLCCNVMCRSASAKKRLAVPYRAADLPSERSEFSQPDVALTYTHLAYYGDGLSKREFKAAVQTLLSRGPSEQAYHYNRWLVQGRTCGAQEPGGHWCWLSRHTMPAGPSACCSGLDTHCRCMRHGIVCPSSGFLLAMCCG